MSRHHRKINLLFLLFFLIFAGSAEAISKRANSKECCICHVLWQDTYSTDIKTLLGKVNSPIVVAGSIGLSSDKEMCFSCHDGYVADSRNTLYKENKHHLVGKPPEWLNLPDTLRLDLNNEFYCGTCHSFHDIYGNEQIGNTAFIRISNDQSQMCMTCHIDKTEQKETHHPYLIKGKNLNPLQLRKKGLKFSADDKIICQSCHAPHARRSLASPIKNSELCLNCHDRKKNLLSTKHDMRTSLPSLKNAKQQSISESGPCGVCHTPHKTNGKWLWAREPVKGNPSSQICLSCHGMDSGFAIKEIGKYSHPVDKKPPLNNGLAKSLPLFLDNGQESPDGHLHCMTCHDVHNWNSNLPFSKGIIGTEGNASNSFLRIVANDSSALCLKCHLDKKQVIPSDHNLNITAPDELNIQSATTNVSGPCGACHIPHNAVSNPLWAKGFSNNDKDLITQMCFACHNKEGAAKEKLIGDNYHPVNVLPYSDHMSEKEKERAKTLPLYENGNKSPDGKMVCLTCHEPHTWDSAKTEFNINYLHKNIEGNATNSFLRKANFPSSDLCKVCHIVSSYVDGTDHDLNVTAPEAVNILGQTVKESGPCGACHLVHNSPNKLKLWGRSYGPISKGENRMNAICTCCHSKGGIAENKIPRIATHPAGKLINNIIKFNREKKGYTPIYDNDGKEVNLGNISCPSCHYASQWDPRSPVKGVNKNIEGDAMNSFLRNTLDNIVCIDCHGLEAIFRYQYFHVPEKRKIDDHTSPRNQKKD